MAVIITTDLKILVHFLPKMVPYNTTPFFIEESTDQSQKIFKFIFAYISFSKWNCKYWQGYAEKLCVM